MANLIDKVSVNSTTYDIGASAGNIALTNTALGANVETALSAVNTRSSALTSRKRLTDFDLATLQKAIVDQDLAKYGLKPGDQKTINGYTYVIAGLNSMKGTHDYTCKYDHCGLIVLSHTTTKWNASGNTYTGANNRGAGYANSDLHYYLVNTTLPHVQNDLGSAHLYSHKKLLGNNVNTTGYNRLGTNSGCTSNSDWYDCYISALTESQVYGGIRWSSSGFDTGEADQQLEVFTKYKHSEIFGDEYTWLRDVASAGAACHAAEYGVAGNDAASYALFATALVLYH